MSRGSASRARSPCRNATSATASRLQIGAEDRADGAHGGPWRAQPDRARDGVEGQMNLRNGKLTAAAGEQKVRSARSVRAAQPRIPTVGDSLSGPHATSRNAVGQAGTSGTCCRGS